MIVLYHNRMDLSSGMFYSIYRYNRCMKIELTREERKIFEKLNTPLKIQDYLDSIPFNKEKTGSTLMSPRRVLGAGRAHCIEGALLASAILWYHGQAPILLDLKTIGRPHDYDHVIALFKINGKWGAISKTNHVVLRYRDPIYKSVRELALSYFHEYFLYTGKKTLRSYSKPFSLKKFGESWITKMEDLWDIEEAIDDSPHLSIVENRDLKNLRRASLFERKIGKIVEWK